MKVFASLVCRALAPSLLVLAGPWAAPAMARAPLGPPAGPGLFGSVETESHNLAPFHKWTGMLERFRTETQRTIPACRTLMRDWCGGASWDEVDEALRGESFPGKLGRVNALMNQATYILDIVNWSADDYWATPGQFFDRDGDCEDYAIAKYMALRALGVDPASMRIVVLQDLNLDAGHAVLTVERDGKRYVLDNQIDRVVEDREIRHYQPLFSINEESWWLHRL